VSEPTRDDASTGGETRRAAERRIRNRALTIGVSVTPFGLSFGAVSVEAHLSLIQVCLLSLVLFSGASQFALVSVIGAGGSYFSAVGTALLLGVRNGLYGARINASLRPSGWRRFLMAEVTIDESTSG
jgi:predicted branched-subunit amino acid permease